MALLYYSDPSLTTLLENMTTQHSSTGDSQEVRVFIANKEPGFRYEDVVITPEDTDGPDETNWISLAADNGGAPGTFGAPGASLTIGEISDNGAHSFWLRITTPAVGQAQNKSDLRLSASFKEFAV